MYLDKTHKLKSAGQLEKLKSTEKMRIRKENKLSGNLKN